MVQSRFPRSNDPCVPRVKGAKGEKCRDLLRGTPHEMSGPKVGRSPEVTLAITVPNAVAAPIK
eukprot:4556573-Pyramimonas_sp.AAC.1